MSKNKKNPSKPIDEGNRRRFTRVALSGDFGAARALLGAQARWPEGNKSAMFDLSYQGAALERPENFSLNQDQQVKLHLELGSSRKFDVEARIAWATANRVGVEFSQLSIDDRVMLDEFLEDRLIGSHLHRVDPRFFNPGVDFQHWYHGPRNTNVFLWTELDGADTVIKRAIVDFDDQHLIYQDGQLQSEGTTMLNPAPVRVESDQEQLRVVLDRDMPIVRRFMEVLSQLSEQEAPLRRLFQELMAMA